MKPLAVIENSIKNSGELQERNESSGKAGKVNARAPGQKQFVVDGVARQKGNGM